MKISLNWLKGYIDINESPEEICELLTMTGLEVEGLDDFQSIKGGLEGVVIGEVLTCDPHPNADKLKLTTVDIGEGSPVQIVCGAPNVKAGQKVPVAKVGATLYPHGGDPFHLSKVKLRGKTSEGMICAEDELGLGDDHRGVMVLDTDMPNGTPATEYFNVTSDKIIDIGLTPNRGDGASHIGVARDLKAVLGRPVKWPSVEDFRPGDPEYPLKVMVENIEACPRYSGLVIENVKIQESPEWLKNKLKAIGIGPINNVVDITNFICHEMGQPLHAFDLQKIKSGKVVVKTLPEGTSFTTLDEEERKLKDFDLMICDDDEGMCIGGVFGGIGTGITENTQDIFLESAYFSPDHIRRTVRHHGLTTDASFRFERGTDPEITVYALKRAALLIQELAEGDIASGIYDIYPEKVENTRVEVKYAHVDRLIGKEIPRDRIRKMLHALDIPTEETEEGFTALVPPYRLDVTREADVIEEILRIYGFNNIEIPVNVGTHYIATFPENDPDWHRHRISELLAANGYYEIITNSLTNPQYTEYTKEFNNKYNVEILNKLSEDLGVLRQTNLFNGLEVIAYNLNRKQLDLKFFEFGTNYSRKGDKFLESHKLSLYLSGNIEKENWRRPVKPVEFHDLAEILQQVIRRTSRKKLNRLPLEGNELYEYSLSLQLDGKKIATLGKLQTGLAKKFDIKQEVFYGEIDWDLLLRKTSDNIVFKEISKFPEVKRDLSLVIDKSVSFEEIKAIAERVERKIIKEINVFDVYEGDRIAKGKKAYALSFILQGIEKTLTEKVIDKTMSRLMRAFEKEVDALIRK